MILLDAYSLKATLTLDSSEYDAALEKVRTQDLPAVSEATEEVTEKTNKMSSALTGTFKVVGAGIAAVVGAVGTASTAFVKMTDDVASYGDTVDKMSQKMGMSATAYQEWDAVMQHSGTSMETLKASMKTLANAAQTGSEAFEKLGISQEQIANMSQEELFSATITALQNVEDETERTYLASKTLGRGATELGALLNTSAEDTQAMKDRVRELGGVMSDEAVKAAAKYKDTLQDMTTAFDGLKRNLVSEFLPSVTTVMDGLTELFAGNDEKGLEIINEGIGDFAENLTNALPKALNVAAGIVTSIGDAITQNAPAILEAGANIVIQLSQSAIQYLPLILDAGKKAVITLAQGLADNVDTIVPVITDAIFDIIDIVTDPETTTVLLDAGGKILVALTDGLLDAIDTLDDRLPEILDRIFEIVEVGGEKLLETGALILHKIVDGIFGEVPILGDALGNVVDVIDEGILPAFKGVLDFLKGDWLLGIAEVGDGFTGVFSNALGVVDSLFGTELEKWYNDLKNWADETSKAVFDAWSEADRIANQATYDASSMRTDIMYAFNANIRNGMGALEAFEDAKNQYVKSADDLVLFNEHLASEFTENNIFDMASKVQRDGVARTQAEIDEANRVMSAYYQAAYGNSVGGFVEMTNEFTDATDNMAETAEKAGKTAKKALTFDTKAIGEYKNLGIVEVLGKEMTEAEEESKKIADTVYSASQDYIEHQTTQLDLSLQEQIVLWKKVQGQFITGSEQFLKAGDKIAQLQKKQTEQTTKDEEKALKDRETALKKWETSSKKIYEEIDKIQEKYAQTMEQTTNQIYNSYDLFEKVPDRVAVSGVDLINNLENQVGSMKKFYEDVETLASRGVSERVIEEIRSKGVSALDQVDALLDLSDDKLSEWSKLADEKYDFSSQEAEKQLSPLKEETDKKIAEQFSELEALEAETGETLGENFAESFANGITKGLSAITDAAKAAYSTVQNILGGDVNAKYTGDATAMKTVTKDQAVINSGAKQQNGSSQPIVMNINGIQYQSFSELVKAVSEEMQVQLERSAAYAGA